jgi:transposase InsO family protein
VKDVWSNRIVGYSINERMTSELAVSALRMAIRRNPTGTTVHRDMGSEFCSRRFQAERDRNGLVGSWVESVLPARTRPWNRSSPCSRRTFSAADAGPPAATSASRSCPGSSAPTTGATGTASSAS